MSESFSKKENRNKKAKAKQDKAQKKQERKLNNNKGKSLEDMLAYVDENGNLSPVPPQGANLDDMAFNEVRSDNRQEPRSPRTAENPIRTGFVSFFNLSKGFGFITDDQSKERVFFHMNQLSQPLKEKDRVTFIQEKTSRGINAINVKKIG